MMSTWLWAASLAAGVAAVVLGAAADRPALHLGLTALVCAGFAVLAAMELRRLVGRRGRRGRPCRLYRRLHGPGVGLGCG